MEQLVPLLYPYIKLQPTKGRILYKPLLLKFVDFTQKPSSKQAKKNKQNPALLHYFHFLLDTYSEHNRQNTFTTLIVNFCEDAHGWWH